MNNNQKKLELEQDIDVETSLENSQRITFDTFSSNVAQRADIDQDKAKKFIHGMFDYIGEGLQTEENISIYRFGTFKKRWKEQRECINPQNQEKITVPAHYRMSFEPASALANEVNRKYRHLTPNVIDELLTLTGLTKVTPEYMALVEKDEQIQQRRKKAKKRALWIFVILLILILLFFATIIFVPAYCYHQNNKVVNFCKQVNQMFGLNSLSDRLRPEEYEEVKIVQPVVIQDITEDEVFDVSPIFVSEDTSDEVVVKPVIVEEKAEEMMATAKDNLMMGRQKIEDYKIQSGDSIFSIAAKYWENQYLWPDLYLLNQKSVSDPDLIYAGRTLEVYEKIGDPENLTKTQREHIVQAYIIVYRVYRAYGESDLNSGIATNNQELVAKGKKRLEDSCWTLYTAIRYDNELLTKYKDAIIQEDIDKINLWITNLAKKAESEQNKNMQ